MNIEEFERDYEKMPYSSIIKAFGFRPQVIMAIEEMSELTKELTKALRGKIKLDNIIEEVADVEIMLAQVKLMFGIENTKIEAEKKRKLDRLKPIVMDTLKEVEANKAYYEGKKRDS